jgi:bifunctional oligoribonuclease and PAP phosphatase NrnA
MPLDWSPFVDLVKRHQRFVLTTHIRPDGDGLGSMLALADVLEAPPLSKTVRMTVASVLPPRYDFLDPTRRIRRFEPPGLSATAKFTGTSPTNRCPTQFKTRNNGTAAP